MYLLPYLRVGTNSYRLLVIGIQSALWSETELTDPMDALEPNGIFLASPLHPIMFGSETLYLAQIDPIKTPLEDYYTWEETTDQETFCLRTLHIIDAIPPPEHAVLDPIPLSLIIQAIKST